MRVLIAAVSLVLAVAEPTSAAPDIASQAGACWNLPPLLKAEPSVTFDIVFDRRGEVEDATALRYTPQGEMGRKVVLSALTALRRCGPYDGATGTVRVLMDRETAGAKPAKPINPFK